MRQGTRFALAGCGVTVIATAVVANHCQITNYGAKACGRAGIKVSGPCPDSVIEDGDCPSLTHTHQAGMTGPPNDLQVTCKYQPQVIQQGVGCVDSGGPVTYIAACQQAGGTSCGGGGGGTD